MKTSLYVVCFGISLLITPAAFATYGGGAWSSSRSTFSTQSVSTSTLLDKDVCPDGDESPSFYDGDCGDVEEKKQDAEVLNRPLTKDEIEAITVIKKQQKQLLSTTPTPKNPKAIIAARYIKEKIATDSALDRWINKNKVAMHIRLLTIFTKLQHAKEKVASKSSPATQRIMAILQYIQDRVVLLVDLDKVSK